MQSAVGTVAGVVTASLTAGRGLTAGQSRSCRSLPYPAAVGSSWAWAGLSATVVAVEVFEGEGCEQSHVRLAARGAGINLTGAAAGELAAQVQTRKGIGPTSVNTATSNRTSIAAPSIQPPFNRLRNRGEHVNPTVISRCPLDQTFTSAGRRFQRRKSRTPA